MIIMKKKFYYTSLLTCLICLILASFAPLQTNAAEKPAPDKEPAVYPLRICSSLGQDITNLLIKDFAAKSGKHIEPHIEYLPPGTSEERFSFIQKGNFDCWLGATIEEYHNANEHKLLEPYTPLEAFKVPLELRNRRNLWTSLYFSHIALISNKERLADLGLYAPAKWEDLLDPLLKNEIVLPNYNLGGSAFGMITSIWQLQGKEAALKYAAKFNQQQPLLYDNALIVADSIYTGKKTVGILPVDYALELEAKHSHLFATVPREANHNIITGVALLKNAQFTKTAQEFIDYLMSDASEETLHKHNHIYLWHVKNYPNNSGRTELVGKLNTPIDDLTWTSTYKAEIIRQWMEAK